MYEPTRHLPLEPEAWNPAIARAMIAEILSDAAAAFDPERFWPAHPLDEGIRNGSNGLLKLHRRLHNRNSLECRRRQAWRATAAYSSATAGLTSLLAGGLPGGFATAASTSSLTRRISGPACDCPTCSSRRSAARVTYSSSGPQQRRPRIGSRRKLSTRVRNHARAIVACDLFVAVTASFRLLLVFVVIEHGSRRLLHLNVTAHPTAAWTLQQLREALGYERRYRHLIHDRDRIFAKSLDQSIERLGLKVLKSPFRSPMANAICERLIGTIRRECLDWMIPMSAAHLRSILKIWARHYNGSRPHMVLGPGVPDPPATAAAFPA